MSYEELDRLGILPGKLRGMTVEQCHECGGTKRADSHCVCQANRVQFDGTLVDRVVGSTVLNTARVSRQSIDEVAARDGLDLNDHADAREAVRQAKRLEHDLAQLADWGDEGAVAENLVPKAEYDAVVAEHDQLEDKLADTRHELEGQSEHVTRLATRLQQERMRRAELHGNVAELDTKLCYVERERDDLKAQLHAVEQERDRLYSDLENREAEANSLRNRVHDLQVDRDELDRGAAELKQRRDDLLVQLVSTEKQRDVADQRAGAAEKERDDLREHLEVSRKRGDELDGALTEAVQERDTLRYRAEDAEARQRGAESERDRLQKIVRLREITAEGLRRRSNTMEHERDQLQSQVEESERERERLRRQYEPTAHEVASEILDNLRRWTG